MLVLPSWSPFFQSHVRMQGRALQLAGAVQRLNLTEDAGDAVLLRAEVKDNDEVHTVEIIREEKRYAVAACTCAAFAACFSKRSMKRSSFSSIFCWRANEASCCFARTARCAS